MVDEDILILDNDVTIATRYLLSELYPVREKDPRAFIQVCCVPMRNAILNRYIEISNNLRARGFDTTELDNTITAEQTKTDTPILSSDLEILLHRK